MSYAEYYNEIRNLIGIFDNFGIMHIAQLYNCSTVLGNQTYNVTGYIIRLITLWGHREKRNL